MMSTLTLRTMTRDDWPEVAELIYVSTNYWYRANGRSAIFTGDPSSTELFCSVYEALDPGCCFVLANARTGRLAGSCFYHPRLTHVSLGIMNVHPNYFGQGVARRLLQAILDLADSQGKPVRLVSSALNLDSFSLYTRAGFVPRAIYQDLILPASEAEIQLNTPEAGRVREASLSDLDAMVELEWEINHIRREQDYRHFLQDAEGIWHVSVLESETGGLDGFLVSIAHPASRMLGPGIARSAPQAAALICAEHNRQRTQPPVFLVPADNAALVQTMYQLGARNCELHFAQIRGDWLPPTGIVMPTFLPESG